MSKRFRRYQAKFDPTTIGRLFELTKDLAIEEERKYQHELHDLNMKVKDICGRLGVPSIWHHWYISYAQGLWYAKKRAKAQTLQAYIDTLYVYWKMMGLDTAVMREIATSLGLTISSDEAIAQKLGFAVTAEVTYQDALKKLDPSCADPEDPTWTPPDGWSYIFALERLEEAYAFAFGDKDYLGSDTHQIVALSVEEKEGYVSIPSGGMLFRAISSVYATRVAIAFRIPYVDVEGLAGEETGVVGVLVEDGSAVLGVAVYTDGSKIDLEDYASRTRVSVPYSTDWMVLVFDYDALKAYLYTPAGELLAEISLTTGSTTRVGYYVVCGGNYITVDVDWVAIKSTAPFFAGY